ncbi:expressed unknown protein [Seminavis robusta]|uniref:PLD phosphodiesterase domain-containing protein n=1 Tax=Seminavis robusta TaxID=568900 RepID=A0A9N8E2W7_9STRA|nr:expressed unknown protein [Seminavis robusta]|eukprot:Sro596_g172750.1 n/a (638) ;mRNA; r:6931-8844
MESSRSISPARSSTTRKALSDFNDATPSRRPKSGKRLCTAESEHQPAQGDAAVDIKKVARCPLGEFSGNTIYRNRIAPCEKRDDGHYCIEELVVPDCASALCTTFDGGHNAAWIERIFHGIERLVIVTGSKDIPQDVGEAVLRKMTKGTKEDSKTAENGATDNRTTINPNRWFWLEAKPHTKGCMHSKVYIFRSKEGLRVIVSGNNLTRTQWQGQRDVFWAQDFPLDTSDRGPERGSFGYDLIPLLRDMTKCAKAKHQAVVDSMIKALFERVNFDVNFCRKEATTARLVYSFPRPKGSIKDRGGWKRLAEVVGAVIPAAQSSVVDHNDQDDSDGSDSDEDDIPRRDDKAGLLFATSGSLGNLEADFLLQMCKAMNGQAPIAKRPAIPKKLAWAETTPKQPVCPKEPSWDDVRERVRCFWPGKATAIEMDLMGLGMLRAMQEKHLKEVFLVGSQRKILHDAIPNPPTKIRSRLFPESGRDFYPVTHGKFMWNDRAGGGVLYVGSHNLSKAAWGLRNAQPKNLEIGVVLGTSSAAKKSEWISRLPCRLVAPNVESPETFSPYTRFKDIADKHPDAQDRLVKQAICLYQEARDRDLFPGDRDFCLEDILLGSQEFIRQFVTEVKEAIAEEAAETEEATRM